MSLLFFTPERALHQCHRATRKKTGYKFNFFRPRFVMQTQSWGCPPHLPQDNLYRFQSTHLIWIYLPWTCPSLDGSLRRQRRLGIGSVTYCKTQTITRRDSQNISGAFTHPGSAICHSYMEEKGVCSKPSYKNYFSTPAGQEDLIIKSLSGSSYCKSHTSSP